MLKHSLRWMWLLLALGVSACAATPLSERGGAGGEEAGPAASFDALCEEASSLVALCAGEQCGLYRCRDVKEHLSVGQVVLARGGALVLPNPQAGAQRNWGSAQQLPQNSRPVLTIPWGHKPPLLPSQQELLAKQAAERRKPHERHHIFPQAFRKWFVAREIDIDEYLIPLEVEKFELFGPVVPLWKQPPPLPSGY